MEQIVNNELFSKLLRKYLNKEYINNAGRLIRDYKGLIEKHTLHYIEKENYMLFFEDREDFYNLYYFISKLNLFIDTGDLSVGKPVVADEVYKESDLSLSVGALLEAGLKKYMTRSYMLLKLIKLDSAEVKLNNNVKFADKDEVNLIFELQNKYIDRYTGNFLFKEEILGEIKDNLILCIHEGTSFAGYLRFKTNNKNVSLEGIVVGPKYRGKGYSKELMKYFIDYFSKERYNKIDLWVRDDNISALKLYEFFDFEKNGYKCDNYIKF